MMVQLKIEHRGIPSVGQVTVGDIHNMAITYSAFLTQVRNYTEVDSNVLTDSLLDQFITTTLN
jgi:hypothetical protein